MKEPEHLLSLTINKTLLFQLLKNRHLYERFELITRLHFIGDYWSRNFSFIGVRKTCNAFFQHRKCRCHVNEQYSLEEIIHHISNLPYTRVFQYKT